MMSEVLRVSMSSDQLNQIEAIFYGSETPMVIFKGTEFTFEMCNEKYKEIYSRRDLLGKPLLEAVPELKDSPFPYVAE
jgi:hypothetical protein